MRYSLFFLAAIFSLGVIAEPAAPTVPLNQNLAALDYSREGRQTGCGLRITGESGGDLWINILLSVFIKESELPLGMFKLVVRRMNMQDGEPMVQDGKLGYTEQGRIQRAWLKTGSGVQLQPYANGMAQHGDGYMTSLGFANAMDLLVAIPQGRFQVGFSRDEIGPEQILEFDQRIATDEAVRLRACMKNLRDELEEKRGEGL